MQSFLECGGRGTFKSLGMIVQSRLTELMESINDNA